MCFSRIDQSKLSSVSCIHLIFVYLMSLITSFVSSFGNWNVCFSLNICFLFLNPVFWHLCKYHALIMRVNTSANHMLMKAACMKCWNAATAALLRDLTHACFNNVIWGFGVHFVYFRCVWFEIQWNACISQQRLSNE